MAGSNRNRSRSAVALAASALVHLTFLGLVLASLPRRGPMPEPPSIEVTLTPLPSARLPMAHHRSAASASGARARPPPPSSTPPAQAPAPASTPEQTPTTGEDQEGLAKVRAVLRGSFGCTEARFARLSREELDRCARWRQAHIDPDLALPAPIPPEKRAWFDAALAARKALGHSAAPVCGVLIDGLRLVKPKTPPHALKLGSLPCFLILPNWSLADETDVETPSRQTAAGTALHLAPRGLFVTSDKGIAPGGP